VIGDSLGLVRVDPEDLSAIIAVEPVCRTVNLHYGSALELHLLIRGTRGDLNDDTLFDRFQEQPLGLEVVPLRHVGNVCREGITTIVKEQPATTKGELAFDHRIPIHADKAGVRQIKSCKE
jgi:hypothetical protein